jgi:hypothetical protein
MVGVGQFFCLQKTSLTASFAKIRKKNETAKCFEENKKII